MIAIFGGGEIAKTGIIPIVGEAVLVTQAHCDVSEPSTVGRMLDLLRPDTVIFTAGVSHPQEIGQWPAEYARELSANLFGAFNVAWWSVHKGVRTFVAIASLAGLYGKPAHSGYSASKAGLISLVQSLAMEGHNAYAISPGRVQTAMRERDYPGEDPRTRLAPTAVGEVVRDILAGKYTSGDNIVMQMRGHEVLPLQIHRGDGWRERLHVGEPKTC